MRPSAWQYCPRCKAELAPYAANIEGDRRQRCPACEFVHYDNPTPVVVAIVETPEGVVLARGRGWPEKVFAPITGFLESREEPSEAVLREVKEELGLEGELGALIGVYGFAAMNQVLIAYHVRAQGEITLCDELDAHKVIPAERLRGWDFATGLAIRDWLALRSRPAAS
jgi:NADH pyrophosphatase NudC (nudix superfamily)